MAGPGGRQRIPPPIDGVRLDLEDELVPPTALSLAENWVMRDGIFMCRPGFGSIGSTQPTGRAQAIFEWQTSAGTDVINVATTTKLFRFDTVSTPWTDLTGTVLTGSATDFPIFRSFNKAGVQYAVMMNGKDRMQKSDNTTGAPAGKFVDAGAVAPPIGRAIGVFANRMIMGNIVNNQNSVAPAGPAPQALIWSASNDFEVYNGAGGDNVVVLLADTNGPIISINEHGNLQAFVWKSDAVYTMYAQGALVPFRIQLTRKDIAGPASPNSVVNVDDGTQRVLGSDGAIYIWDGNTYRSMGRNIQKFIQAYCDITNLKYASLAWDNDRRELLVMFPQIPNTDANMGAVVNIDNGTIWPMRWGPPGGEKLFSCARKVNVLSGDRWDQLTGNWASYVVTWASLFEIVRAMLVGSTTGNMAYDFGLQGGDLGVSTPSFFQTGLSDMGSPAVWELINEIDHDILTNGSSGDATCLAKVATRGYGEAPVLDVGTVIPLGNGPYRTGHRSVGRYCGIRVETQSLQQILEYHGANVTFAERGLR